MSGKGNCQNLQNPQVSQPIILVVFAECYTIGVMDQKEAPEFPWGNLGNISLATAGFLSGTQFQMTFVAFLKWGYPQIIHLKLGFCMKQTIHSGIPPSKEINVEPAVPKTCDFLILDRPVICTAVAYQPTGTRWCPRSFSFSKLLQ